MPLWAPQSQTSGVENDTGFRTALSEAQKGSEEGGVPIGACLVSAEGKILGKGHNMRIQKSSATLHVSNTKAAHHPEMLSVQTNKLVERRDTPALPSPTMTGGFSQRIHPTSISDLFSRQKYPAWRMLAVSQLPLTVVLPCTPLSHHVICALVLVSCIK